MSTAADVMLEAAVLCGDRNQTLYTNDKLLPLLKRANRELGQHLQNHSLAVVEKEHVSNTIVAVTGLEYPNYPTDFSMPISLWERPDTSLSDADWEPMSEVEWAPDESQTLYLRYWKFQEDKIRFLGALEAKKVKLLYSASPSVIVDATTTITVRDSEGFLAARTASFAARFVGKNVALGVQLSGDAQEALDLLLGIRVKEDQNEVLRMLPYSMNRRRG